MFVFGIGGVNAAKEGVVGPRMTAQLLHPRRVVKGDENDENDDDDDDDGNDDWSVQKATMEAETMRRQSTSTTARLRISDSRKAALGKLQKTSLKA